MRGKGYAQFLEYPENTGQLSFVRTDCHRVVHQGWILLIVVLDLGKYAHGDYEFRRRKMAEVRDPTPDRHDCYSDRHFSNKAKVINAVFRLAHTHKFTDDAESLDYLPRKHEFANVLRRDIGKPQTEGNSIDQVFQCCERLYIAGLK